MNDHAHRYRTFLFILACTAVLASPSYAGTVIMVPSKDAPTISLALIQAKPFDTVLVAPGVYNEHLLVKSEVVVKSRSLFKAILDGKGKGVVVTLGGSAVVCGFEIRNGTIGVKSTGASNGIYKCLITGNRQSGIACAGHAPTIEDNVIAFNKGSGIQGWDLKSTSSSINHNTVAFNSNNGIAVGGTSNIIIENNIIAYNEQNGLKMDESVKFSLTKNDFFQNGIMPRGLPENNFLLDPKFKEPKGKLDFSLQADSPIRNKNEDIGARLDRY
jgi:parallel beta-helix repeat protein